MSTNTSVTEKKNEPFYQVVDGFRIPGAFSAEAYRGSLKFQPQEDDVLVVTYPKCGTTWIQNIVSGIYRQGKPFTSFLEFMTQNPFMEMVGLEAIKNMKRPACIKYHLPFQLIPWSTKAKYIFVARNPKDCCVSFFHHTKNFPLYHYEDGEFDHYFELFIEGQVDFGDYFDTLLSWWEHRNDPNVLFITYEEVKKHTRESILKIAEFMGEKYKILLENNPAVLDTVLEQSSFEFMKKEFNRLLAEMSSIPVELILSNPDLPPGMRELIQKNGALTSSDNAQVQFIRKGKIGDWKNHFSPMQNARMERKYRERTLGTDIPKLWKDDM